MKKVMLRLFFVTLLVIPLGLVLLKLGDFVPAPDYLPKDKHWTLEDRRSNKGIFGRHVYCRYTISCPAQQIKESLKNTIHALHTWEAVTETTSLDIQKTLDEEVEQRYSNLKGEPDLFKTWYESQIAKAIAPSFGDKYAVFTQKPFTVLKFSGHKGPATHWHLHARIIERDSQNCILELWDYQDYDH